MMEAISSYDAVAIGTSGREAGMSSVCEL